jgi:hypothetical protein
VAQFRTDKNIIDSGQVTTRYEVFMLSDQLTPSGSMLDAFGRLRTSDPFTIFDNQMIGHEGRKFDSANTGAGQWAFSANNSLVEMSVGTSANDSVIRQSRRVMPYQPGKSTLVLNTFAFGTPKANCVQRVGLFDDKNGIYFENDGQTNYLVIRTSTNGGVERRIPQIEWNVDRFDGTGYSSQSADSAHDTGIDVTKTNIFWIDIEWLGVGDVRCGFVVDGKPIVAHIFHNDNRGTTPYMASATLPIRFEIRNVGTTSSSTTMKQICSSCSLEGGQQGKSLLQGISRGFTLAQAVDLGAAGNEVPLISIRLRTDRPYSVVIPHASHIYVDSNASVSYRWIKNATVNGTWVQHSTQGSPVEYNIDSTTITLGPNHQVIQGGFITAGAASVAGGLDNYEYQLGRFLDGTSETFTLTAIGMSNNTKILSKLDWFQLV